VRAPSPFRVASMIAWMACALAPGAAASPRAAARPTAPRPPRMEVQPIGARAASATDELRERVRDHVARQLRVLAEARLLAAPAGYLVDGSIDALEIVARGDTLDLSCSVRLVVSARASGAMIAMTTGQAAIKNVRRGGRPGAEARLTLDVLDGATRAATEELIAHFEARRKS
jgi:hypothetical protein